MTFQYFFFDTVAGYFLQALPFALAAGVWYALRLHKKEPALPGGRVVLRSLFPCYFAGLLVFTIFLYPVPCFRSLLSAVLRQALPGRAAVVCDGLRFFL